LIPCSKHEDRRHEVDPKREVQHDTCACGLVFDLRWNDPTPEQAAALARGEALT
jgi:hypothetical protein